MATFHSYDDAIFTNYTYWSLCSLKCVDEPIQRVLIRVCRLRDETRGGYVPGINWVIGWLRVRGLGVSYRGYG